MSRFLIVFNAPMPMSEFMVQSTSEERQAGLEAWDKWRAEAEKSVIFEYGAVVQAVKRILKDELVESPNQASNYAFAEAASKEVVIKALQDHPHLQRNDATIDVLEVLPMPGQ